MFILNTDHPGSLGYFRVVLIFQSLFKRNVWAGCLYVCSSSALPKVSFELRAIDHRGIGYQIIDFSELVWPQTGLESAEARQS